MLHKTSKKTPRYSHRKVLNSLYDIIPFYSSAKIIIFIYTRKFYGNKILEIMKKNKLTSNGQNDIFNRVCNTELDLQQRKPMKTLIRIVVKLTRHTKDINTAPANLCVLVIDRQQRRTASIAPVDEIKERNDIVVHGFGRAAIEETSLHVVCPELMTARREKDTNTILAAVITLRQFLHSRKIPERTSLTHHTERSVGVYHRTDIDVGNAIAGLLLNEKLLITHTVNIFLQRYNNFA